MRIHYHLSTYWGRRRRDNMVLGFTTTCANSSYHNCIYICSRTMKINSAYTIKIISWLDFWRYTNIYQHPVWGYVRHYTNIYQHLVWGYVRQYTNIYQHLVWGYVRQCTNIYQHLVWGYLKQLFLFIFDRWIICNKR